MFSKKKNLKLETARFIISEEVEFGGSVISAEMVQGEDIVNILSKHGRIKAFQNLKEPESKKELQSFQGILLQGWCLSILLNLPLLRKACGAKGKIYWTQEMNSKYIEVSKLMQTQIKISPYNPLMELNLAIDRASLFLRGYRIKKKRSTSWILFINAGSSLLPPSQGELSPVECEAIALDRACVSCRHWIFNADKVSLVSDCSGILDMLDKPLNEVTNRRLQRIMERVGNYNIINQHIPGTKNSCLSNLKFLTHWSRSYQRKLV